MPDLWPSAPGQRRWWAEKLAANAARDRRTDTTLTFLGWRVLRFWEHEDPDAVTDAICAELVVPSADLRIATDRLSSHAPRDRSSAGGGSR